MTVSEGLARAAIVSRLSQDITAQRAKFGNKMVLLELTCECALTFIDHIDFHLLTKPLFSYTEDQQDHLLQVGYLKTDLQCRFLALIKEKCPLTRVCLPGEQTTLGKC